MVRVIRVWLGYAPLVLHILPYIIVGPKGNPLPSLTVAYTCCKYKSVGVNLIIIQHSAHTSRPVRV